MPGSEPAKVTVPDAGAPTRAPALQPTSIPRCWPAAYGSSTSENGRRTEPSHGHDHALADGTSTSATTATSARRSMGDLRCCLDWKRDSQLSGRVGRCQDGLQRAAVEGVAGYAGETRHEVGGPPAGEARVDELGHRPPGPGGLRP